MRLTLSSPEPNHQAKRQRIGAETERRFVALLEASELAGLGVLRKRPTAVVVRAGKPRFTGTAGCDFSGHLRGGRAAYVELKHVDVPRLSLDMLRPSQRAELARAHADGALAAIAVFVGPLARAWLSVLPWPVVAGHIEAGDASVPCAALEAWRVPATVPVLAARWTEASTWAR